MTDICGTQAGAAVVSAAARHVVGAVAGAGDAVVAFAISPGQAFGQRFGVSLGPTPVEQAGTAGEVAMVIGIGDPVTILPNLRIARFTNGLGPH